MKIIGVVSGGFDPLHAGHVRMLLASESMCGELIVLVNTDAWLLRKKGYVSVPLDQRIEVVSAVVRGASVYAAIDEDNTVVQSLINIRENTPDDDLIFFFNGGDRREGNVPEESVDGVRMVYGVGGSDKTNSSSTITPKAYIARVDRLWGHYEDHFRNEQCVFKTLYIKQDHGTSLQRHQYRHEQWFIEEGTVVIEGEGYMVTARSGDSFHIPPMKWHSVTAVGGDAVVREMQYGLLCSEDDIERK